MNPSIRKLSNHVLGYVLALCDRSFKRSITLVCHNHIFESKMRALQEELKALGIPSRYFSTTKTRNLYRLLHSHNLCVCFAFDPPSWSLPEKLIVFNFDPIWENWLLKQDDWMQAIRRAHSVWSFTPESVEFLKDYNQKVFLVPLGYSESYASPILRSDRPPSSKVAQDVIFYGQLSERREKVLEAFKEEGISVRTITWKDELSGDELDREICNSRVVICIHKYDDPRSQYIDFARLDRLLSNRVFVIHEKIPDQASAWLGDCPIPFFSPSEAVKCVSSYLSDPEKIEKVSSETKEWFSQKFSLRDYLSATELRGVIQ